MRTCYSGVDSLIVAAGCLPKPRGSLVVVGACRSAGIAARIHALAPSEGVEELYAWRDDGDDGDGDGAGSGALRLDVHGMQEGLCTDGGLEDKKEGALKANEGFLEEEERPMNDGENVVVSGEG